MIGLGLGTYYILSGGAPGRFTLRQYVRNRTENRRIYFAVSSFSTSVLAFLDSLKPFLKGNILQSGE